MKILVCGSREVVNMESVFWHLDGIVEALQLVEPTIITGGAKGADRIAETWAKVRNYNLVVVPADWNADGRSAGYKRNARMLQLNPDLTVGFIQGVSKGTRHMLQLSEHAGIKTIHFQIGGK